MKIIKRILKLASAALLIHVAGASAAPMEGPNAGLFVNGGIGLEGRQTMHAQRQHYNLHLRFVQARTGEYLAGVGVAIAPQARKKGSLYFEDAGPWLYVRLRPGSYRITAMAEGRKQVRNVTVGKSHTDVVIYWR